MKQYIERLEQGDECKFRPRGNSMKGKIESGQLCTVRPVTDPEELAVGDIVLCKVRGHVYLHLVKSIRGPKGNRDFQIGNNRGGTNGWTRAIYGKCIKVEP